MLLLLAGSAFFSGTETAFFNLSHRQKNILQKSEHKFQILAAKLLNKPRELLSCLLFGNMIVNTLFYAAAGVLTIRIKQQVSLTAAAAAACLLFCLLVLFGEILPKSVAYANSRPITTATALPIFICMKVFNPFLFVLRFLLVEPVLRLILGRPKSAKPITATEFRLLMEQMQKRGLITADENKLLSEVIELGFLKVRDCIRPRVDMVTCAVTDSPQKAREKMKKNHLTKLPVYLGKVDNIVGLVHLRQLLLRPDESLDRLIQPVHFVPEQKTIESLLEFFRQSGTDTALAVDEYGGIAGSITLEDIAEELLGPIELADSVVPIEQTGPFTYRLAGSLAIHDWARNFGIDASQSRISTIAGLVTALLGKIPKTGDVAHLNNLKFTVEAVRKHRIETVILTLEPLSNDD